MSELLTLYQNICDLKKRAGFNASTDILKLVTEEMAHKYYGGDLIGGSEKGRDIKGSPTHRDVSVKGRPIKHFTKQNTPELRTPIRTSHWNFDYVVVVMFEPEYTEFYEMIEFTKDYFQKHARKDDHDNRWEMGLTIPHYKAGRKFK